MDNAAPNLPSRDFETTSSFYCRLGFEERWRNLGWMILQRGTLTLEFFPHPNLEPADSWFSCCLRMDDPAAFYNACLDAAVPEQGEGQPRLYPPREDENGLLIGALIDPDGTLIRLIQN